MGYNRLQGMMNDAEEAWGDGPGGAAVELEFGGVLLRPSWEQLEAAWVAAGVPRALDGGGGAFERAVWSLGAWLEEAWEESGIEGVRVVLEDLGATEAQVAALVGKENQCSALSKAKDALVAKWMEVMPGMIDGRVVMVACATILEATVKEAEGQMRRDEFEAFREVHRALLREMLDDLS